MGLVAEAELVSYFSQVNLAMLTNVIDRPFHSKNALVLLGCHFHPVFEKAFHMALTDFQVLCERARFRIVSHTVQSLLKCAGDQPGEPEVVISPALHRAHAAYVVATGFEAGKERNETGQLPRVTGQYRGPAKVLADQAIADGRLKADTRQL